MYRDPLAPRWDGHGVFCRSAAALPRRYGGYPPVTRIAWLLALLLLAIPFAAGAHEVRPAYLEITERSDGRADILWKQPTQGDVAVALHPEIAGGLLARRPDAVERQTGFSLARWNGVMLGKDGLDRREVRIAGLDRTITEALVIIHLKNGDTLQEIIGPARPGFVIRAAGGIAVSAYLRLGIGHILTGVDHLLFVFGLILLCSTTRSLLLTITAFTAAHSLTLALTALKVLEVNPQLVETLVALSIVFLAVELAYKYSAKYTGRRSTAQRFPWAVAFAFGLMHGAAFAGALRDIGLPAGNIPAALLLFNLGVEIGQLLFIAGVAVLFRIARLGRFPEGTTALARWASIYAIGSFAAFWFLERAQIAFTAVS
jgi:hydrogenase/urease accessory protein HupE